MAKPARSFKSGYVGRTREDINERANRSTGGFDKFLKPKYKTFTPKVGKNLVRICPPPTGETKYGLDIYVNYQIGVDNQSYLSLSRMLSKPDPIAEARRVAEEEQDEERMKALRPTPRVLLWIIDRNSEDEGPMLWACPATLEKEIAGLCVDDDTKDIILIDSPESGCDISFTKEGAQRNTKYNMVKIRKESPLHEDPAIVQEWQEFIDANALPDTLQYYDYKHIKRVFGGAGADDDEDGDTKVRSKRRVVDDDDEDGKEQPKTRRKATVDDEDEKDADVNVKTRRGKAAVDDDDDDADEEEVKPKARRKVAVEEPDDDDDADEVKLRSKRKAAPADDDDDADDDEDEKPAKTSIRDKIAARRKAPVDEDDDD